MFTMKDTVLPEVKSLNNNLNKNIKRVFWLIFTLFILVIGCIIKIVVFDRNTISTNSYNQRLNYADNRVKRGDIKDINGNVMAYSEKGQDNTYLRVYPYNKKAVHITGYVGAGKTGIEAVENFELQKIKNEVMQSFGSVFKGTEIVGNNVVLTVDMDIQELADKLLGDQNGAAVVIEPSTGRIIAMASHPNYDPNNVAEKWDDLKSNEYSPLINRAIQGLYAPGSTFKVITALSAMRNIDDWETFTYECKGEAKFEDKIIHCFDNKVHGTVNIHKALAVSCNCFFAELSKKVGAEQLAVTAEKMMLNKSIKFTLGLNKSTFPLGKYSSESELVETSIGQGKTSVTPLYMAMVASAIANGGTMMQPYIVDHFEDYKGKSSNVTIPVKIGNLMTIEETTKLTEMMIEVINNGTGGAAQVSTAQSAGKSGTAENAGGNDHSWFIAFAPAEKPEVAVAVVLENASRGKKAAPIAGKLMSAYLNK